MPKLQLKISGVGKGTPEKRFTAYEGPPLVAGVYVVKLKRMVHKTIKSAANAGADRFELVLEVVGPDHASEFFGAPIFDGLNVIDGFGMQQCNAFLHALSGATTSRAKTAIEKAFYEGDMQYVEQDFQGNKTIHITKIGKIPVNSPKGERLMKAVVRIQKGDGQYGPKPVVGEFLPYDGEQTGKTNASEDLGEDVLAGLEDDATVDAEPDDAGDDNVVDGDFGDNVIGDDDDVDVEGDPDRPF